MDTSATKVQQQRGSTGVELPLERPWCCVCHRSSDVKWAKHAFTKSHQQRAIEFLQQRTTALLKLLVIPKDAVNSSGVLQALAARKWNCGFCELQEYVYDYSALL